jgi:hypothetical protein
MHETYLGTKAEEEPDLTLGMIRAGVAAYQRWNPHREEIEALIVEVYLTMWEARPSWPEDLRSPPVSHLQASRRRLTLQ